MSKAPTKRNRKTVVHHAARYVLGGVGVSVFAALIVGTFAFSATLAGPGLGSGQMAAVVSARLVDLTNADRSSDQLGTLTVNPVLVQAAQAKADDMAKNGYFAHTSPSGLTSWYWFKQAGYSFAYAGENLAVDFTDSDTVNQAWLDSPTHRANILDGHYTQIGIATAQGMFEGHETTFVVQMFGTPPASVAPIAAATQPADATQVAVAQTVPVKATVLSASTEMPKNSPAEKSVVNKVAPASSTMATGTAVAAIQPSEPIAPAVRGSLLASLLGSPRALLRDVYIFFALILAIALAFRTEFEFKHHHRKHVFAVLALFVLMGGLFVTADRLVFVAPVLGTAQSI